MERKGARVISIDIARNGGPTQPDGPQSPASAGRLSLHKWKALSAVAMFHRASKSVRSIARNLNAAELAVEIELRMDRACAVADLEAYRMRAERAERLLSERRAA